MLIELCPDVSESLDSENTRVMDNRKLIRKTCELKAAVGFRSMG